ncbi:MAG: hypothetical protein ABIH69_07605 [bacterium]
MIRRYKTLSFLLLALFFLSFFSFKGYGIPKDYRKLSFGIRYWHLMPGVRLSGTNDFAATAAYGRVGENYGFLMDYSLFPWLDVGSSITLLSKAGANVSYTYPDLNFSNLSFNNSLLTTEFKVYFLEFFDPFVDVFLSSALVYSALTEKFRIETEGITEDISFSGSSLNIYAGVGLTLPIFEYLSLDFEQWFYVNTISSNFVSLPTGINKYYYPMWNINLRAKL